MAAVALLGMPSTGSAAATPPTQPDHVAFYVAGVGTACSSAKSDGLTDLASVYNVTVGQNTHDGLYGLVLVINGVGNANSDQPDYWSYWHWTDGRWVYAQTGPADYHPKAGSAEGWAYGSYGASSTPPLPAADYAQLCGSKDPKIAAAAPKTSPRATPKASSASVKATPKPATTPTTVAATPTPRVTPSASQTPSARNLVSSDAASTSVDPTTSRAPPSPSASPGSPSGSVVGAGGAVRGSNTAGPSLGAIGAIGAIAILGGVVYLRTRQRR